MNRVNNLTPRGLAYQIGKNSIMYPLKVTPSDFGSRWHNEKEYTQEMKLEDVLKYVYNINSSEAYKETHYPNGMVVVQTDKMTLGMGREGYKQFLDIFHKQLQKEYAFLKNTLNEN